MKLTDEQRARLDELLARVQGECEHALGDLSDKDPNCAIRDETVYELDGAVTELFEYLNDSTDGRSIADRAVKWANDR